MFILSSNITITDPTGNRYIENLPIIEVKIKKSRKTLTNTATITMPRNLKVFENSKKTDINTIIQRGAAVTVQIGYDGNLKTRFSGFVSSVSAEIPLTIECQDTMWTLKQNSFTKSWGKGTKVADIVKYIYSGPQQVVDLEIGGFVAVKESTAQILNRLRKYVLISYFGTDANGVNTLYVDFAGAVHPNSNEVIYVFGQNIIKNDLHYKLKEDARIKVIGVSKLPNGKKIQIVAGDNDGEIHTLHYSNLDADHLQLVVNAEINKLKYTGYKGSFTTWGLPEIEPGDKALLKDLIYPEHDGAYLVEAVEITFGKGGYRHMVEPGIQLALTT